MAATLQNVPQIPSLPPNRTAVQVFSDFLRYLYECTKRYIQETEVNGRTLWESLEGSIHFVLTHPNGWEGYQQSQLRRASVLAQLIPDTTEGHDRVSFVTEGEASLHFCLLSGLEERLKKSDKGVLIIDAGGGTIDLSAYRYRAEKESFEEIAASRCLFQGSVFVTARAKQYLQDFLKESQFAEDLDDIVRGFDKRAKHTFRDENQTQFIKVGMPRVHEPLLNIRSGQLKLQGSTMAKFFQPSIMALTSTIEDLLATSNYPITAAVLVGGFAASDWLYRKLEQRLSNEGIELWRPDRHTNKAVSNGGVSFHLNSVVKARISRAAYGARLFVEYCNGLAEHRQLEHLVIQHPISGIKGIPELFDTILKRNVQVYETQEFRRTYHLTHVKSQGPLNRKTSETIVRYTGTSELPLWREAPDPEAYSTVCRIEADLSAVIPQKRYNSVTLEPYTTRKYHIVILFGRTELKAQFAWTENGVEKRTPAQIIYEPDDETSPSPELPGPGLN
ncbi:hypothetical protein CC2G_008487 [Coprinopsis cinerea AmutBmut pab1-1]|nr:hypothetical protein CC2G_008487 [Coprinopsis cinerea AmutBmut pab1-1]